jgi:hypothetical protein
MLAGTLFLANTNQESLQYQLKRQVLDIPQS